MTAPTFPPADRGAPVYGLRIARADAGRDAVVRLDGELEMATTARLREELARALATECERIVVDLRPLAFIDSTGMHALVQADERCRAKGRSLTLLLAHGSSVERTLHLCGLLELLEHEGAAEPLAA